MGQTQSCLCPYSKEVQDIIDRERKECIRRLDSGYHITTTICDELEFWYGAKWHNRYDKASDLKITDSSGNIILVSNKRTSDLAKALIMDFIGLVTLPVRWVDHQRTNDW